MFKHLPVLGALAPVGVGLWVIHPTTATSFIMAGTVGSAIVESKLRSMNEARKERKATKAEAKEVAGLREEMERRQELPQTSQSNLDERLADMRRRAMVINYEDAGQAVAKRVV